MIITNSILSISFPLVIMTSLTLLHTLRGFPWAGLCRHLGGFLSRFLFSFGAAETHKFETGTKEMKKSVCTMYHDLTQCTCFTCWERNSVISLVSVDSYADSEQQICSPRLWEWSDSQRTLTDSGSYCRSKQQIMSGSHCGSTAVVLILE